MRALFLIFLNLLERVFFLQGKGLAKSMIIAVVENELFIFKIENSLAVIIQKCLVMADKQKRAFVFFEVAFQPNGRFPVQVVGRLVQQQNIRVWKQRAGQS